MFGRFRGGAAALVEPAPTAEPRPAPAPEPTAPARPVSFEDSERYIDLKVSLHRKLIDVINLAALDKMERDDIAREVNEILGDLLADEQIALNAGERSRLTRDIIDELLGLGPLEPLLKDPTVSDILVNTHAQVFIERRGTLELSSVKFRDERHLRRIIDRIVAAVGRRVDESQPMVDARLPDGSRVNAVVPPVAIDGSIVSIRKFSRTPLGVDRLVATGSITPEIAQVLRAVVKSRLNVLISGGTGTGKTTMLNALSSFIDERERVVTIEDAAELQLQQAHVVRLETRPANIEGRGEIAQRELVKNALRMRPDRIILGECRAGEAFDMLQAMNTGHDGSMTTIHANTCRDALGRLEQLIGMTGMNLPPRSMRAQIASAIHVIVQIRRFSDGRRRLVSLSEITGMEGEIVTMQEIFRFDQHGVDADGTVRGAHIATGVRPRFFEHAAACGLELPSRLFAPNHTLG
ncbi:CpaF family protein [Azospirillum rugosum]|uniref:Pilus assembly protein CpaF n=1 Tax=Azospirillum rugosum TaxID=416170 RepID=A0ABS4SMH5_9PROT|nr:CpaF family protein [Azospirillum rugosum]MBP2293763.1 pilus assembly protein CpaF [Azospirillum rugosum]MDQ0527308.1 pilus assembly protein CpaF [Azospirillum rugosum]